MISRFGPMLVTLALVGCGLLPNGKNETPKTCTANVLNVQGTQLDKSPVAVADQCVGFEYLTASSFKFTFNPAGAVDTFTVEGRNLKDLDLNTVGDYACSFNGGDLTAVGTPTDHNSAYDGGAIVSYNQNTAVAGDCLHASCKVSVTSAASSGQLSLHFTGHLARGKAGAVPPFYCDYVDLAFDLQVKVTPPLN